MAAPRSWPGPLWEVDADEAQLAGGGGDHVDLEPVERAGGDVLRAREGDTLGAGPGGVRVRVADGRARQRPVGHRGPHQVGLDLRGTGGAVRVLVVQAEAG